MNSESKSTVLFNILNLSDISPKKYSANNVKLSINRENMKTIGDIFGKESVKLLVG